MANETAKSTLSPSTNTQGAQVQSRQFKITDIPDAMDKIGWPVSAALMRHWFAGKPWDTPNGGMTREVKTHQLPTPAQYVEETIVKMSWVVSYPRAQEVAKVLEANWNNMSAQAEIKRHVAAFSAGKAPGYYPLRFNGVASKAEAFGYSNSRVVEFNQEGDDDLNDLRGALANFNMRVVAEGDVVIDAQGIRLVADTIGFYAEDSYDFEDNTLISQPLGFWNFDGIAPSVGEALSKNGTITQQERVLGYQSPFQDDATSNQTFRQLEQGRYYLIQNSSFQKYRDRHKAGGDFTVYSDILYKKLTAPVVIVIK